MDKSAKTILIKYGCSTAFVALLAGLYFLGQDFAGADLVNRYRIVCDAFSIPGVVLVMFGSLVWASNQGALLGVSYVVRYAVFSLIPGKRLEREERFGDYVLRKREQKVTGYGFLFYTGLAALAVALVFMGLFYAHYQK